MLDAVAEFIISKLFLLVCSAAEFLSLGYDRKINVLRESTDR